jgi:hypothetical protein
MRVVVADHILAELNEHRRAIRLVAGLPEIRSALGPNRLQTVKMETIRKRRMENLFPSLFARPRFILTKWTAYGRSGHLPGYYRT